MLKIKRVVWIRNPDPSDRLLTNQYIYIYFSAACLDRFDPLYKNSCFITPNKSTTAHKEWHIYYYFDRTTKRCEMFWYSGCARDISSSRNIFSHLSTCYQMCKKTNVLVSSGYIFI